MAPPAELGQPVRGASTEDPAARSAQGAVASGCKRAQEDRDGARAVAGAARHLRRRGVRGPRSRPALAGLERWRPAAFRGGGLASGRCTPTDADTWLYALGATKTDTGGVRREKPLRGPAAQALSAWLAAAPADSGPLFRRLYKGGKVSTTALSADQVARIVQRRAQLAGLEGDWAAHSLRSGFVTEAGRQGVPSGEVMAMTEHRGVGTVMGYFQAGALLDSRATDLLGPKA